MGTAAANEGDNAKVAQRIEEVVVENFMLVHGERVMKYGYTGFFL